MFFDETNDVVFLHGKYGLWRSGGAPFNASPSQIADFMKVGGLKQDGGTK